MHNNTFIDTFKQFISAVGLSLKKKNLVDIATHLKMLFVI